MQIWFRIIFIRFFWWSDISDPKSEDFWWGTDRNFSFSNIRKYLKQADNFGYFVSNIHNILLCNQIFENIRFHDLISENMRRSDLIWNFFFDLFIENSNFLVIGYPIQFEISDIRNLLISENFWYPKFSYILKFQISEIFLYPEILDVGLDRL